ncbi:hypothetical protein RDV78_01815 [Bacillota bacterium LX-D]|nr:hypothetical protein [Bacillota bacterium LX-D]
MVISVQKIVKLLAVFFLLTSTLLVWYLWVPNSTQSVMGGFVHQSKYDLENYAKIRNKENEYSERFQRPAKEQALNLKYHFQLPEQIDEGKLPKIAPGYPGNYANAVDVIHAYYSILKEAANMYGYSGGCGTVGLDKLPYPYAYELLSPSKKMQLPLSSFIQSFSGIGHTTLLKVLPAYMPPDTPENRQYHLVEIEVITGPRYKENKAQPSCFAYYYGLITTEQVASGGWKIKSLNYLPEDFLCAPYHHWDWDAPSIVEAIYKNWYGLIDKIVNIERKDSLIYVYAIGKQGRYRFDFVRLTNGYDILLHEYIAQGIRWKETNLLKKEHQDFKFSILNSCFKN